MMTFTQAISSQSPDAYKGRIPLQISSSAKTGLDKASTAAQDFEAVFISEMIKPMFETVEVDDTFGGGKGEEVFRGLMVQELGKSLAKRGGLGLSDQVNAELLKLQEHKKAS